MEMAELGATPKGGVNRPALTPTDIEVHVRLAEWARAREFAVEIDAYGNQFMRRSGSESRAGAIASGSHSDTQPTGGRFDGISGVLSAVEALEVIDDAGQIKDIFSKTTAEDTDTLQFVLRELKQIPEAVAELG